MQFKLPVMFLVIAVSLELLDLFWWYLQKQSVSLQMFADIVDII